MARRSVVPGVRFDGKRKRASFEVTLPGTNGRRRRRKTVKASTRDKALNLFRQFRDVVLAERFPEPETFSEFVTRFWPLNPPESERWPRRPGVRVTAPPRFFASPGSSTSLHTPTRF